jgi:hypothetical protein
VLSNAIGFVLQRIVDGPDRQLPLQQDRSGTAVRWIGGEPLDRHVPSAAQEARQRVNGARRMRL